MATHHTITVKTVAYVTMSITTSDEEYKVYKLIDWPEEISHGDIDIRFDYGEMFSIESDDSDYIGEDEE